MENKLATWNDMGNGQMWLRLKERGDLGEFWLWKGWQHAENKIKKLNCQASINLICLPDDFIEVH